MSNSLDFQLRGMEIERKFKRRENVAKAAIGMGGIVATYLLLSGADALLNDMSFKDALAEPLTDIKAGGYCAYMVGLTARFF